MLKFWNNYKMLFDCYKRFVTVIAYYIDYLIILHYEYQYPVCWFHSTEL